MMDVFSLKDIEERMLGDAPELSPNTVCNDVDIGSIGNVEYKKNIIPHVYLKSKIPKNAVIHQILR